MVDERKDIVKMNHAKSKVRYVRRPMMMKKNRSYKKRKDIYANKVLQKLFDSCREVFKGPGAVPSDSDVTRLCTILDEMKPKHVGLSKNMQFFKIQSSAVNGTPSPRVAYTTIYQCQEFSLCIFFLPATAVIPLHNHPGMTVFSKLLVGNLHIKSYDWVDNSQLPANAPSSHLRLARLKADRVLKSPCETSVLYPTTGGNIHEFRAITPCAVLDVLGPPYSKQDHRDCSYYKDLPLSRGEIGRVNEEEGDHYCYYRWLEEIEMPEDSQMDRIEYMGPQIIETSFF